MPIDPAPSVIDHVARPRDPRERRRHVVERAARRRPAPVTLRRIAAASASSVTPGNRLLAGGVDVGQHDVIGAGQRRAERVHQRRRPREAVRLKRDDDAAVRACRAAASTAAISVG